MSYPPAAMTRAKASAYCDLSVAEFEREVAAGRLPAPFKVGRKGARGWFEWVPEMAAAITLAKQDKRWWGDGPLGDLDASDDNKDPTPPDEDEVIVITPPSS